MDGSSVPSYKRKAKLVLETTAAVCNHKRKFKVSGRRPQAAVEHQRSDASADKKQQSRRHSGAIESKGDLAGCELIQRLDMAAVALITRPLHEARRAPRQRADNIIADTCVGNAIFQAVSLLLVTLTSS